MSNPRLAGAVTCALLAAGAGALAVGLEAPALGAVAAVAGVAAAALASLAVAAARPVTTTGTGAAPTSDPPAPEPALGTPPRPRSPRPAPSHPDRAEGTGSRSGVVELVDPTTGLLDHRYFPVALERRVSASRRKLAPFSLVLLELQPRAGQVSEQSMKVLAAVVRAVLRESDTACRIDRSTIAVLLEDTAEEGALWATERVRGGFFATTFRGNVLLSAGIASYPAHALEPGELLGRAREATTRARESGAETVEMARPADEPTS